MKIKVGARSSRLSRAQAEIVFSLLKQRLRGELSLELVPVRTAGDSLPPKEARALRAGAKGSFTGELERLLLSGEIDVAVHSMKDMASEPTEGLRVGATPPRSDPRDALITADGSTINELPNGARVGTSSLRRKAQLLRIREDLQVVELHGNIDSRLRKLSGGGGLDAVVLAVAGLERIGEGARISQTFSIDEMVPAVGQGTIAVQIRADDREVEKVLATIDDRGTSLEWECEMAFARRLGVDCNVPVGGCARASGSAITMVGAIAEDDGSMLRRHVVDGPSGEPEAVGKRLAEELLQVAPPRRSQAR